MQIQSKIYVAGHNGLVGSALVRMLKREGYKNLITRTHGELDLTDAKAVADFFALERPEYVFLAAARVGGIGANATDPALFIRDNLLIQTNVVHNAYLHGVKKLLFLGSSCIYPKMASQPIREEYFMSGVLEPTNEAYAVAKIAGIVMCQSYNKQYGTDFISVMPTNLYGPNDNFDIETSHVLPALIRKFDDAKNNGLLSVMLWGTGEPRREFLHVDDLARACAFLMSNYSGSEIINIGTGNDLSIRELADIVKDIVGYEGEIVWDTSRPNGTPRKVLDVSKITDLGWKATIALAEGITDTYVWYIEHKTK
ncbi:MAG: GDP-L-fucose synthase [Candidatus Paceibacterota bacterium]